MCYKLSCSKFSYLWKCSKESLHMHQYKISGFIEAIKDLCIEVQQICRNDVNGSRLIPATNELMRQHNSASDVSDVSAALTKL
jgi:hypothetical protein